MRNKLIVFLLCLQSAGVSAQSYLSLNVGPALPTGEYSATNINDDISGFADLGISGSIKYTQWLNNHTIGFMLDAGLMSNPFNEEQFVAGLGQQGAGTSDITINSEAYRIITVMPGILIGKYNEKWDSDVYGFMKVGMMSLTSPYLEISSGEQLDTIDSQSATGFGYGIGVGAHWTLAGNFGMSGTVEYVGGTARLEGYDQPVGNLNALLGVLVHF